MMNNGTPSKKRLDRSSLKLFIRRISFKLIELRSIALYTLLICMFAIGALQHDMASQYARFIIENNNNDLGIRGLDGITTNHIVNSMRRQQRASRRRRQIDDVRVYCPRVFYMFNYEDWNTPAYFNEDEASTDNILVYNGYNYNDGGDGGEEDQPQCIPMASWQTTSYPNCNVVHEISLVSSRGSVFPQYNQQHRRRRALSAHPEIIHINHKLNGRGITKEESSIEFLGQGWFRSAWELYTENIPEYDEEEEEWGYEESVVLKTLRIERDFLEEYYELHRRDALAMERLTFSPYVMDIYGYCGQSTINELANFGDGIASLEKVAQSFRWYTDEQDVERVSKIKLDLSSDIATGVSHMHSIDYRDFPKRYDSDDKPLQNFNEESKGISNATLVHNDLNPHNIAIVKRGKPKLNDFNVAEFMTWDRINNTTCGFKSRFHEPWWRSPEEMQAHLPDKYPNPPQLTEKIDIYSLGNILWNVLTTYTPRGKQMKKKREYVTRQMVANGTLPSRPNDFNQTTLLTNPALRAIEKAAQKCLRPKPEDRPTAGEIANELSEAIKNLPEGFGDRQKWERQRRQSENKVEWI